VRIRWQVSKEAAIDIKPDATRRFDHCMSRNVPEQAWQHWFQTNKRSIYPLREASPTLSVAT
jgi:hypothetical protein